MTASSAPLTVTIDLHAGNELARELDRGVRSRSRRVSFVGSTAFGPRLRVDRFRLGNGLTILLQEDRSSSVVAYHTWFRVGSRYEEPGKTGLAHFFEHMMFNETATLAYGEFDRLMDAAGAETNAATWIDWTYYHESLPSEELPLAIRLESDRMANLVIRKPQIESEREVVANERRMAVDDDVAGTAGETLYALAFGRRHPHGWPTIGWMKDIKAYKVSDCRDFYRTWYAPNNATIVVVGDFEPRDVLARIQAAYGDLRASKLPPRRPPPPPRQHAERRTELSWPTPSEKIDVAWHAAPHASFDNAVLEVIDDLLTGGRSARLRRRLIEDLEIVSELRGGTSSLQHGGLFEIWVSMREGHPASKALAIIEKEIARLIKRRVPSDELEKIKNRMELFFLSEIETVGGRAGQIGFADVVTGNAAHAFVRLEELRRVTPGDVQRVAAQYLAPERRSVVHVVPKVAA